MPQDHAKPIPDWREIASLVSAESDPNRVLELAKSLINALDESSERHLEKVTPESKMREPGAA